jgi:Flp pilus assembly protein TadD
MIKDKKQLDRNLKDLEHAINKGRISQAHARLVSLLKKHPFDSRVLTLSAQVYALRGSYQVAKSIATKASIVNRSNNKARHVLGFCLQRLGNYGEAADIYRQIIQRVPTSAVAYFFLGESLRMAGETDDAYSAYQEAAILDKEGDLKRLAEKKIIELKESP